ncbi:hypothetical protein [Pukyongiella litopenaei]|uniref:Lipoprotein n=1 Tax=Pukyongiella litopenaei TaxID=2605946 RepID=A0A2S0MUL2_9RHOB|nr:hypothetical protein [Pukyongiella litopenaei]AVO39590.1 hypothetical protein C6Y53_01475 [Pukyongiella litopenaei]
MQADRKFARRLLAGLALCGTLAACGETVGERALYGGTAGAVGAAVLNGNLALGAVGGAAANMLYCDLYPGRCR